MMRLRHLLATSVVIAAFESMATPFWGAKHSAPADTPIEALKPGELIWEAAVEPEGPVVVVVSLPEQMAYVLRNGVEIGRARIEIDNPGEPLGTHAYTVLAGGDGRHPRWSAVGLPGHAAESRGAHDHDAVERLHMPQALASQLYPLLEAGTTMLVTDAPVLEHHTTGPSLYVMSSGLPEPEPADYSPEARNFGVAAPVESILID